MAAVETALWVARLLALAVALQTIELLAVRRYLRPDAVWSWSLLRGDYPKSWQACLSIFFDYKPFVALLGARLLASLFLLHPRFALSPVVLGVLWLSSFCVCLRWRGSYNGGSDSMTLVVLSALGLASCFGTERAWTGALWYIALQSVLSYTIAGVVKWRQPGWRSGAALLDFLRSSTYEVPAGVARLGVVSRGLAWGILAFECGFPLVFLSPTLCRIGLMLGLLFHGANAYIFGLNRFLLIWVATYPAIDACSRYWR